MDTANPKRALRARIIHVLQEDAVPKIEEIFAITDPKAAATAMEMANLFTQAIGPDLRFNLSYAQELVKQNSDMVLYNLIDRTFIRHDILVESLVVEMTNYLSDVIDVVVDEVLKNQIRMAIQDVFVNLNIQKEDAWIFWAKESGHQTTYRYNILFAVQNALTGNYVLGLPLALTVTVEREYERVLFITIKDELTLSVRMEGLKAGKLLPQATVKILHSNLFAYN